METQFISNTSRKPFRQHSFRNVPTRKNISTSKKFRFSDIEVSSKVNNLPYEINSLLLNLNLNYDKNFTTNQKIDSNELSDVLLKSLCNTFDLKLSSLNIDNTQIVVEENLIHDMYQFDLKPFFKLKTKSPILFDAFCFFVHNTPISVIDLDENELLNEFSLEFLGELLEDKVSSKEKKSIKLAIQDNKKCKAVLSDLRKKNQRQNKEDVKKSLTTYKPKNKVFILIKEALLMWLDLDFSFLYSYPFQYYTNASFKRSLVNEEETEYYDFYNFIYFKLSDNKRIESEIEERFKDIYNNYQITNPCWIINQEKQESSLKKAIVDFENFVIEYFKIINLLKK